VVFTRWVLDPQPTHDGRNLLPAEFCIAHVDVAVQGHRQADDRWNDKHARWIWALRHRCRVVVAVGAAAGPRAASPVARLAFVVCRIDAEAVLDTIDLDARVKNAPADKTQRAVLFRVNKVVHVNVNWKSAAHAVAAAKGARIFGIGHDAQRAKPSHVCRGVGGVSGAPAATATTSEHQERGAKKNRFDGSKGEKESKFPKQIEWETKRL
jgi:hypothetical protein